MVVKQSESESLRDFLGRCNEETITIPKLQQEVVVLALISGVKDGDCRSYMGRNSLNTLAIVLGKPNEFIKSEEFNRTSNIRRGDYEIAKEEKRGGQGKKEAKKEVVHTGIAKGKEKKEKF